MHIMLTLMKTDQTKLFESLFCSPKLHLFHQKYSKNTNIVKYYSNLK